MLSAASITRGVRRVLTQSSRSLYRLRPKQQPQQARVVLDPRISRCSYSTTPALFRKFEGHNNDHINAHKVSASQEEDQDHAAIPPQDTKEDKKNTRMLSDSDDLMVGNEGLETIDPKDFPELYPSDEDIEGLSQESHPDNERDFEGIDTEEYILEDDNEASSSGSKSTSVLLSDKERTEEEFSWFVDESYPEQVGDHDEKSIPGGEFVPLWQKNVQRAPASSLETERHKEVSLEHSPDSVEGLVRLLESERARNIKVIDMRDKCDWTNWMVIAEGLSERHLGNVADQVYSALKKSSPKTSPPIMEGRDTSDWVVIDAGSVVIHFMTPEARKERDLEGLWASVKNPLKLKDAEDISWEDVKGKMTKSWKESPGRSRGEDGKRGRRGERDIPLSEVVKW
ncbi:hypothetical protein BGX28_004204 [Mortierella sp. GBA30]|nr:hypothetical protein BGX28_004204 [Mortierella sp. GBA30]